MEDIIASQMKASRKRAIHHVHSRIFKRVPVVTLSKITKRNRNPFHLEWFSIIEMENDRQK